MYFTILRDPIDRYISEWLHMRRKRSFWKESSLRCQGESPPPRYVACDFVEDLNTTELSFYRYVNCPNSLSNNRQTRMLASLDDLKCYSHLSEWSQSISPGGQENISFSSHQIDLLTSAIDNLAIDFATFGFIEHSVYTQYMYRMVLGLVFRRSFTNESDDSWTSKAYRTPGFFPPDWKIMSEARNRLDEAFISFARVIFSRRLAARLRVESALPVRWRLLLRRLDPGLLISDVSLETAVCRYLTRFFHAEAARRQALENS